MRFNYKDLLDHTSCCRNCDNRSDVKINGLDRIYCPDQEQLVMESGICDAYDGFWKDIIIRE